MKKIFVAVCVLVFFNLFSQTALAYSDENAESIAEQAGADGIKSEYLNEEELSGDRNINVFEKAFDIVVDAFKDNGISVVKSFGAVLAVILLNCVMSAMKFGGSEVIDTACGYISVLALSGVTYSVLYNLFVFVIASMEALTIAMSSLSSIMASLYVFGGTSATGAAGSGGLTLFFSVLSIICTKVLLPLLQISFALCLVGAVPASVNLSAVTSLVKNAATTLMAFIFTLLGFTLYLQTAVASASDTYVTRSIKFASGVFVPVIGNMLGDAARTVISSVSIVKGTVGAAGVVIVFSAVLPSIIAVVLNKLLLLGCGIIAKSLGCERESTFLYDLLGVTNVLLALVMGAGVICIIALAVFIKSGVTV
ncbi:MAG: hypothetical protein J6Q89_01610 [Clostridia bacterium]|nr:hypothetical protein [Clostridia bacterium]